MADLKVAGCAGHGGYKTLEPKAYATAGKRTPDGEPEWIFNDKVIDAFEKELLTYQNVQFLRTDDRTGKTDVPLQKRTDEANDWGADLYVSFHHNADKGTWDDHTGTETYTHGSGEGLEIGKLIQAALVKAYGLKDRGMKTKNLHIIRETKMPAVLTEGGYMDSTIDIKKMRDDKVLANAGKLAAQAVAAYYKLKKKPAPKPVVPAVPKGLPEVHKIAAGDTLWGIANKYKKFGMTVHKLQNYNPDVDPAALKIGDTLQLMQPVKKYTSLVDFLNDHKMKADFKSRIALATKLGIKGYRGTAAQNVELLKKLQK